jgi:CBS domain-containing protein
MHRYARYALVALATAGLCLAGGTAQAQSNTSGDWKAPPGSGNKKKVQTVSANEAVVIAREILVKHGYEVVRVEIVEDTRVIYYRMGNRGRGKGKGRLQKIVVRREPERVVFVDAPRAVQVDINVRLGL